MILDKGRTSILIEEQVIEDRTLASVDYDLLTIRWTANLDGESLEGESIAMSRDGRTPDDALRNLFEAMSAARVTL